MFGFGNALSAKEHTGGTPKTAAQEDGYHFGEPAIRKPSRNPPFF